MNKFFISITLIGLVFAGCMGTQAKPEISKFTKPEWINNSQGGAVGSCGSHMDGTAAQEKVAMDRAVTALAKQKQSNVISHSTGTEKENALGYTSSNTNKTEVTSNAQVSSTTKATWRDPKTNIFYIWMVAQ